MFMLVSLALASYVALLFMVPSKKNHQIYGKKTSRGTYQNIEVDTLVRTPKAGIDTIAKLFTHAVEQNGDRNCLGTREILSTEEQKQPDGKVFIKQTRGDYVWKTFKEVDARASRIGSGLLKLGLKPGDKVAMFADTCEDWQTCAQACFRYNFTVVTVYATLGDEAVAHAINLTEAANVITSSKLCEKLLKIDGVNVKNIITFEEPKQKAGNANIVTLAAVEESGKDLLAPEPPKATDTAVIMFTSGSTGLPKGVVISHGNIVAGVGGVSPTITNMGPQDVYVGYLPLAHVLELVAETSVLASGASIGYSSPLTLSDSSAGIKKGTKGDVSVLRPTLMACVPAVMEKIRKAINTKMGASPVLKAIFEAAFALKKQSLRTGLPFPLVNPLFKKTAGLLGGRVRLVLSGGAPLSAETEMFMNVCFGCPVGQGYGLTETCGTGTIKPAADVEFGRVGPPVHSCEIKLVDWPEGGYTKADKPFPRGEVVLGGGAVTQGYYKMEEKTKAEFKEEDGQRWFYTGDIGEMHDDGCLKIVDRKKDLVKLQHGEYISLGKVESVIKTCPEVENCCVHAQSSEDYCICIVVPQEAAFNKMVKGLGLSGDVSTLASNDKVINKLLQAVQTTAKNGGLHKFEVPKKIIISPEVWTPENGLVTAAMKLKRNVVNKYFEKEIAAQY